MFTAIIWATDGSDDADRALETVRMLAEPGRARVIVAHADERLVGRAGGHPAHADEDDLQAKIRTQAKTLQAAGIQVELKIMPAVGTRAAHAIAEAARETKADLIVVGTRGHAPVAGLLVGSVTQRLLHISPCPVLVVPPERPAEDTHVPGGAGPS